MQVLKFGGSSVANATNISRVLDIVLSSSTDDKLIMVCSAISGCTDTLLEIGRRLEAGDSGASELIGRLKEKHFCIIKRLFTGKDREEVEKECGELFSQIAGGPEVIESFGELLSTRIIAAKLKCEGVDALWLDSRDIICSDDLDRTYSNMESVISTHPETRIFIAPGFIARNSKGKVTTLGRGGSDYSAALYAAGIHASSLQIWTDVPGIMTANPKDVPAARTIPRMSYESAWDMAGHGAKVLYPPTVEPAKKAGIDINILNSFCPSEKGTVIGNYGEGSFRWVGVTCTDNTVCLVSEGQTDIQSTFNRIRSTLERSSIDVSDLHTEGQCILATVGEEMGKEALKALHREFFELEALNTLNLYIAGKGAVGTALCSLIESTATMIRERSGKTLRIVAVADSKTPHFCEEIIAATPQNAVFVDCTNSESIYRYYIPLMEAGVDIVSSNRRSFSIPYAEYAEIKKAARRTGRKLKYETTVGAALPILESIALSANSSDEITSIEAVVSCTLNYILSSDLPYKEALENARKIGLTEKDPSQDLEGKDALRKLLILAREAGVHLDACDVEIEPVSDLEKIGQNQRFVASLVKKGDGYKAAIRLETVGEDHPAYWLKGTDNLIIVRSAFHPSPLIIQGAGEGAKVAASSILNDLLS